MKHRVGRRSQENSAARSRVWPILMERCKGRCELCGTDQRLVWAHCMGRPGSGFTLGSWANSAELTTILCSAGFGQNGCHEIVDGHLDHDLVVEFRAAAAGRLYERIPTYESPPMVVDEDLEDWYADEIRGMVRELEAKGVQP